MCMQPSCNRLKAHSDNGFTYDIPSYNKNNAYMQLIIITTLDYLFIYLYFLHECRSYYRCTQDHCRVKKRVERLAEDPRMVITTYEGRHVHSPSHDSEDSEAQTHLNNFFWYTLFSLSLSLSF